MTKSEQVRACDRLRLCVFLCGSVDRIQQLRREYQQARREGMVPPYEELNPRRRGHENDAHRVRSSDTHTHTYTYKHLKKQIHRQTEGQVNSLIIS